MKIAVPAGTTSKKIKIYIGDSSSTTGGGLTGLAYNSAGLTWYYTKDGDSSATQVTLATATVGTFTSGGFKEVDSTNMPGVYEIGIPNSAIAAGDCHMMLKGATNMVPVAIEIQTTNLPANTQQVGGQTASASGTVTFPNATLASTSNITTVATVTNLTNAPTNGDLTAAMKASVTTAVPTVAQIAAAVWGYATSGMVVVGSVGEWLRALFSGMTSLPRWLGVIAGKTADSDILDEIQATPAGAGFDNATDSLEAVRDGVFATILRTQLTESYATLGTAPTVEQLLFLVMQSLNEFAITGDKRSIKKLDGTTQAAEFTLNSTTSPTATTRSA